MREELEEWLSLQMVSGKYSAGLVDELTTHYVNRTLHVHMVLDEIAALEGRPGAKPSNTKSEALFQRRILKGLWHKHFMQPGYIGQNLQNHWTDERLEQLLRDVPTSRIPYDLVLRGYTERAGNGAPDAPPALTGEWIVFAKHDDLNYYLTLGVHGDDRRIWSRCRACAAEFPELSILKENRSPESNGEQ